MRYRLERRDGHREVPAWWNVGGTAFHETVREWETAATGDVTPSVDATAERFPHHLANAIADELLNDPLKTPMSEWRVGGRESQQYPNKENRLWWLDKGPEMVAKYVTAQEGRGCEILRIGQQSEALALELGFLWHIDDLGELPPLKGYIDQVLYFPDTDSILVRDYKSGSHTPTDTLQLKVYRLALEQVYGITARKWWGDYWMARKGYATKGLDLTDSARCEAEVRYRLHSMHVAEELNLYPPNPTNMCSSCGVREHCPAMSDSPTALWKHGQIYDRAVPPVAVAPLSISE